jgi:hypothetical protein
VKSSKVLSLHLVPQWRQQKNVNPRFTRSRRQGVGWVHSAGSTARTVGRSGALSDRRSGDADSRAAPADANWRMLGEGREEGCGFAVRNGR